MWLAVTRGVDSVDASFCSFSCAFWRATLLSQHTQARATKIKLRCQPLENNVIVRPGIFAEKNAAARKFQVSKQTIRVHWLAAHRLGGELKNVNNTRSGAT